MNIVRPSRDYEDIECGMTWVRAGIEMQDEINKVRQVSAHHNTQDSEYEHNIGL